MHHPPNEVPLFSYTGLAPAFDASLPSRKRRVTVRSSSGSAAPPGGDVAVAARGQGAGDGAVIDAAAGHAPTQLVKMAVAPTLGGRLLGAMNGDSRP